jgi:RNA:NAD 2'-phosphotransferase (TPT1/KptA family)
MPTLYHVTPKKNLPSILAQGLLPNRPAGLVHCAVWLVAAALLPWAVGHTQARHGVALDEVVILEVNAPRGWLTRHQRGFWRTSNTIPAARIVRVVPARELFTLSPVLGG